MLGKGAQAKGDDWSFERIVKQSLFKNLGGVHKEWTGVSAQEMGDNRHCPIVKPLLNKTTPGKTLLTTSKKAFYLR